MSYLVPRFWLRWCEVMFGVSPKFAGKVWHELEVSAALLCQIGVCDTSEAPREIWQGRMRHFRDLLDPADLLAVSLRLSPETGKPRHPDAIKLEEGVLYMLDRHGRWLVF